MESHQNQVVSLAGQLLMAGGLLESTSGDEPLNTNEIAKALESRIAESINRNQLKNELIIKTAAAEALVQAKGALSKTANGTPASNLSDVEIASLEAIIEVTGRPAVRYTNGKIQTPSGIGDDERWKVIVVTSRHKIEDASSSVGRIMAKNELGITANMGTGWRLGNDLVVTNRHVAQLLAKDPNVDPSDLKLEDTKQPSIDFAATDDSDENKSFSLTSIEFCAAEQFVDLAILRVSANNDLPDSLELDWNSQSLGKDVPGSNGAGPSFKGKEVYVVGHPFKQRRSEAVASVFGTADGLKRWSPGIVKGVDTNQPTLRHDCSTLGGNSGSCVFSIDHKVVGIHMGGVDVDDVTDRGLANLAVALSRLDVHPVVQILKDASA